MPIIVTHGNDARHANDELRRQLRAQMEQNQLPSEGAHLVIEGQIKKPAKTSQYALDMLTLPEDK